MTSRWRRLVVWVYTRTPETARRLVVRAVAPRYTVGVLAVVRRPDGRVLLVDLPYRPGWSLPGGDLHRGETASQGASRELREELGLQVTLSQPSLAHQRVSDRWITFVVQVDVDQTTADSVLPSSPELTSVGWFRPDAFPTLDADAVEPLRLVGGLR